MMTDDEKHEWCRERTGFPAVILPPSLYDKIEKEGILDMRWYVRSEHISAA